MVQVSLNPIYKGKTAFKRHRDLIGINDYYKKNEGQIKRQYNYNYRVKRKLFIVDCM